MKWIRIGRRQRVGGLILAALISILLGACGIVDTEPRIEILNPPASAYCYQDIGFRATLHDLAEVDISKIEWDFGDGSSGVGLSSVHVFDTAGTYLIGVAVWLYGGRTARAETSVVVSDGLEFLGSAPIRLVPDEYESIGDAICASNTGDAVVVKPGEYEENVNFGNKDIIITCIAREDKSIVRQTVIIGVRPGISTVTIGRGQTVDAMLTGFTIRSGSTWNPDYSGGISVRNADPTLSYNRIEGHKTGGLYLVNSGSRVEYNVFDSNTNNLGGGGIVILCGSRFPSVCFNTFEKNTAPQGGAIHISSMGIGGEGGATRTVLIKGNTFSNNKCVKRPGFDALGSALYVTDCSLIEYDETSNVFEEGNCRDDIFCERSD